MTLELIHEIEDDDGSLAGMEAGWKTALTPQLHFGPSLGGHVRLNTGVEIPVSRRDYDFRVHAMLTWDFADGWFWKGGEGTGHSGRRVEARALSHSRSRLPGRYRVRWLGIHLARACSTVAGSAHLRVST